MPAALSSRNNFMSDALHCDKQRSTIRTNNRRNEVQKRHLYHEMLKNSEAAILAERNRISGELHNSIGHTISAAIVQVNALQYITVQDEVKTITNLPVAKQERKSFKELNSRENDVMDLLADGLNNKEIAQRLSLSEGTVRNYISSILEKLNLRDRTQILVYYYTK